MTARVTPTEIESVLSLILSHNLSDYARSRLDVHYDPRFPHLFEVREIGARIVAIIGFTPLPDERTTSILRDVKVAIEQMALGQTMAVAIRNGEALGEPAFSRPCPPPTHTYKGRALIVLEVREVLVDVQFVDEPSARCLSIGRQHFERLATRVQHPNSEAN